jgi:hypothetical protein
MTKMKTDSRSRNAILPTRTRDEKRMRISRGQSCIVLLKLAQICSFGKLYLFVLVKHKCHMPYGLRNVQRRLYLKKYEPYIHSLGYSTAPHTILASTLTRLVRWNIKPLQNSHWTWKLADSSFVFRHEVWFSQSGPGNRYSFQVFSPWSQFIMAKSWSS